MMRREVNLIGGFYRDESLPFSSQDAINWLPEPDESGMGRSPWRMLGVPGLKSLTVSLSTLTIVGGGGPAQIGQAFTVTYSGQLGETPYSYRLTEGNLPPGLTLNASTGVISGTPTFSGVYQYTVTVTDAGGFTASARSAITVANAEGTIPPGAGEVLRPFNIPLSNGDFSRGSELWAVGEQFASPGWSYQSGMGRTGPGFVRWTASTGLGPFDEDTYIYQQVIPSAGLTVVGTGWARCTSIGTTTESLYAQAAIRAEVFADEACTIPLGAKFDMFMRFFEVLDWRQITSSVAAGPGQFIRLRFYASSGVAATLEFDDLTAVGYGAQP